MSLVQTEGIVLRSRPFGEADKVLTIFSDHGKRSGSKERGVRSRLWAPRNPFPI